MNMTKSVLAICFFSNLLFSQTSASQYYRSAVMDGNNVKTVFGNWGVIGQPSDSRPRGAWKKINNGYFGDESFFIGLQFPIKDYTDDGKPDTVHSVITTPVARPTKSPDASPSGDYWTFMPTASSTNPTSQSVAISNNPLSWPSDWNNQWKGLNVPGTMVADLESYFQVNDDNDHRYDTPSNNPYNKNFTERNGQGITVDVRYLQFNHPLFKDVLFRVYDIKNESSLNYEKVVFGYLMGTYVGVTGNTSDRYGEYGDDFSILHKNENVVITGDYDFNCDQNPFWQGRVGMFGNGFISSPNNNHIASYNYFVPAGDIDLSNDEKLWKMLKPGYFSTPSSIVNDTIASQGEDGDYTFGSNYFTLLSGQVHRISSVLVYGYAKNEIIQKIAFARILYNNNFDISKIGTQLHITNLSSLKVISGVQNIEWQSTKTGGTVKILFSPNAGNSWISIAENIPNNGSYSWNTSSDNDCSFGLISIIGIDAEGKEYDIAYSPYLKIKNSENVSPFIKIVLPEFDTEITEKEIEISALIGDVESSPLVLSMYYSTGGAFHLMESREVLTDSAEQKIVLNLEKYPNSNTLQLQFLISDGLKNYSIETDKFKKQNTRNFISSSNATFINHNTDAQINVSVFDQSKVTNDTYIISFLDTSRSAPKTFSVRNVTKGQDVFVNELFTSNTESPLFDGLRLNVSDVPTLKKSTKWSAGDSIMKIGVLMEYFEVGSLDIVSYSFPSDYRIYFSNTVVDTSLALYGSEAIPMKFKVFNATTNSFIKIVYSDDVGYEYLYFYEKILDKFRFTWMTYLFSQEGAKEPAGGDTLYLFTQKGVSFLDTLKIFNLPTHIDNKKENVPDEYLLYQNYPNPFNPTTVINYQLPVNSFVTLKVYDILGKEIATLVKDFKETGKYSVTFDASKLASGTYIYKLTADKFSDVKKLILLK